MEIRKVFKAGNSLVVSLPKQAIKELGLAEGSPLAIQIDAERKQLTMRLVQLDAQPGGGSRYAQMVEDFLDKYEGILQELG